MLSNDCCFLTNIHLNAERVHHLLQYRFQRNSSKTSFDFKLFPPEQPLDNIKVSRSLLRCQPKLNISNDYEDNFSSYSSSSDDDDQDEVFSNNDNDDDRLQKLAEWDPSKFQSVNDTDEEEEDDNPIEPLTSVETNDEDHSSDSMDISTIENISTNPVEDLLVTYIHVPVKTEPISDDEDHMFDHPPQLDGQIDIVSSKGKQTDEQKRFEQTVARIRAKTPVPNRTIRLNNIDIPQATFRLNDNTKKTPIATTPRRKSLSKIERPKETKRSKKILTPLFTSVLKTNEDIIRPLQVPFPRNLQKVSRLSSDPTCQPTQSKMDVQRKSLSMDERSAKVPTRTPSLVLNKQKSLSNAVLANVKSKEKSVSDHMTIAQKKLTHFQKTQPTKSANLNTNSASTSSIKSKKKSKILIQLLTAKSSDVRKVQSTSTKTIINKNQPTKLKKLKRLDNQSSTTSIQMATEKLLIQNQPRSEPSIQGSNKRPANFFEGCITIDDDDDDNDEGDDDDIQEIERKAYFTGHSIHNREKLLDHIVHSPAMRVKWLLNLDSILLEHISICHGKNIRPLNLQSLVKTDLLPHSSIYSIDPPLISTIIINFLKLFLLRNSSIDQQNILFNQFGLTSHLRYLFLQLPTYQHIDEKDPSESCSHCHQYSLIINILFDFLFDLLEYDLCEISSKNKYRSSLIEDDYFTRFNQTKFSSKEPFYRIRLVIYLIELIGLHIHQCSKRKSFQFNQNERKFFHSIEDFLRHILSHITNLQNQRISLCFNVIELCLLFVNEKSIRIEQMALFLVELCENFPDYVRFIMFDKNLLPDIRLLVINELIGKKFHRKFLSIEHIPQIFDQIHQSFNSIDSIDESVLLLVRSLFHSYADLILEIKFLPLMYSNVTRDTQRVLHHQLEITYEKLLAMAYKESEVFDKIKPILFFYRLLKCKWNQL